MNGTATSCRTCAHFVGDALAFERDLPGLRTMGSGFASVRGDDGLCKQHQRFVAARSRCEHFALRRVIPGSAIEGSTERGG